MIVEICTNILLLNLKYYFSEHVFFLFIIAARDITSISSFGHESLMMLSVWSFVCITETGDSNAVQQTSQEFSFDAGMACDSSVCSGILGYRIDSRLYLHLFRISRFLIHYRIENMRILFRLAIRVAGRRMSHLNRMPLISWLFYIIFIIFNKSFKLYFTRPKKIIIIRNNF